MYVCIFSRLKVVKSLVAVATSEYSPHKSFVYICFQPFAEKHAITKNSKKKKLEKRTISKDREGNPNGEVNLIFELFAKS